MCQVLQYKREVGHAARCGANSWGWGQRMRALGVAECIPILEF